ncbi:ribosome biogenesis protein UTP30 [Kwoniella heveanensis CBS 569]|nr:ribosome biogenesis protein UTP30 [Kwoniella heveanensis CBS 569]
MPPPIKLFSSNPSSSKPKKSPIQPLPSAFSEVQASKAVEALLKHHKKVQAEKEESELIPREEHVFLVVNTKRGSTRKSMMPVRIQLPNPPLPPPPATSVCLISKTPQREYKDLLASPAHNIKFISRVVGLEKLKGKFKPYEARRELMRDHEIFLCDERVLPLMPGLLGKMFFDSKKQPIPVNMNRKDLKAELGRAISSTYFHPSTGTSYSIRISTPSSSTSSQTLSNLLSAIPQVIANIQDGWDNVLSIGIKTSSSVMLPVYSAKLNGRFDVAPKPAATAEKKDLEMAGEEDAEVAEEEEEDETKKVEKKGVKSVGAKASTKSAVVDDKKTKKKSSTIGSGSAGKRAKDVAVGKATAAVGTKKTKSK